MWSVWRRTIPPGQLTLRSNRPLAIRQLATRIFDDEHPDDENYDPKVNAGKKKVRSLKRAYLRAGKIGPREDLAEVLASNVVYFDPEGDKNGLVAINKVLDLPKNPTKDSPHSWTGVLPNLADRLEVKELKTVKLSERSVSAVG